MKVTIKASGVMVVQSVSELEAYALRMWGEVNEGLIPDSIIIKSDFPVDNPYPEIPDHKERTTDSIKGDIQDMMIDVCVDTGPKALDEGRNKLAAYWHQRGKESGQKAFDELMSTMDRELREGNK